MTPPPTGDQARVLAADLWGSLAREFIRTGSRLPVRDVGGRPAALWPLTQVLHAAVLLEAVGVADPPVTEVVASLGRYDSRRGWTATSRPALRRVVYHDDNAWLGLALVQDALLSGRHEWLPAAGRALDVAARGEDPAGGIRWSERARSRHACASAPVALLALRLAEVQGGPVEKRTRDFVDRQLRFLDNQLTRADGLVADRVDADGRRHDEVWSYNQGALIGAHRLAADLLDRPRSRERLATITAAVGRHYDPDRLWREPPAFVAVLLRQLMALDAARGDDAHGPLVDAWLDRVRRDGLDPATGLVGAGGIGRYGDSRVIDQAAVVQVAALRAMTPDRRRLAC